MENQNEPLLIRPSGPLKQIPKGIFVLSLSLLLVPVHDCIPVIFHVISKNFSTIFTNLFNTAQIGMIGTYKHSPEPCITFGLGFV